MSTIRNTAYKIKADIVDSENGLNVEEGALHVYNNELKVHLNGSIETVSTGGSESPVILGKAVNGSVNGSTTITKSASILIAANTFDLNDVINIKANFLKENPSTFSDIEGYIYINTSDSLTGATLVAKATTVSQNSFLGIERTFLFGNFYGVGFVGFPSYTFGYTDVTSSQYFDLVGVNKLVDNYIIFATKATTSTPEQLALKNATITKI